MKNYLLLFGLCSLLVLASCKDEEEKIDPIVGEWELDEVEFTDLPAAFLSYEGFTDINVYGEALYSLTINADNTYERELRFPTQRIEDEGEWERTDDELELDPEDAVGLPEVFDIVGEIEEDEMVLSASLSYTLLPDAVTDTATIETQEQLQALFEEYGQTVELTGLHYFEK